MTDLEKFLRQASRGLWGRERQTVRRELESHIRHRVQRYEVDGSNEAEAIKLAIADLGEPREINSGMKGVYIMPTTIRAGVLTAALATFVFMGTQLSTAQIAGTTVYPTAACLLDKKLSFMIGSDEIPCDSGFSVSLKSLRAVLEPLGVTFENYGTKGSTTIRFPEGNATTLNELSNQDWKDSKGNQVTVPVVEGYLPLEFFLTQLRATALPINIEGWENPQIRVGKTTFVLGTSDSPLKANTLFGALLYSNLDGYLPGGTTEPLWFTTENQRFTNVTILAPKKTFNHTIQTKMNPGTVVAVLSREGQITLQGINPITKKTVTQTQQKSRYAYLTQVGTDGTISYTSFSRTLAAVNVNQVQRGVANGHATIAIARFTGEYTYKTNPLEAIAPDSIKIESR
jgi:hypothetical protein